MGDAPPRFTLGQLLATPGALRALADAGQSPLEFIRRHQAGDWGEVDDEDKQENDFSVIRGFRILSAYRTSGDVRIWVITEADRSATTILSALVTTSFTLVRSELDLVWKPSA
jgi:hypothetical protein